MTKELILQKFDLLLSKGLVYFSDVSIYAEMGTIVLIYVLAYILTSRVIKYTPAFRAPAAADEQSTLRKLGFRCSKLLFPLFAIMLLRLSLEISQLLLDHNWLMRSALLIAMLLLFQSFIDIFITNSWVAKALRWIGLPIVFLHMVGALSGIVDILESMAFEVGNIRLSAYGIVRVLIFGSLLFWLGRQSNIVAQSMIRNQQSLDFRTREVFAKLFEIGVYVVIFLLLLQIMGVNLTALAVFGGAVGVGLGFGLQAIASNFISGLIILLDRSLSLGDYIELEDGRTGIVTQLNMRSSTLETYDGKDIVVPNEKFISSSFINWTHKNHKQRYRVDFSVSYDTDVRSMVELIKEVVCEHPQVLSGESTPFEERPDCEIDSFGDSGINMFVEFWMEGIDDGRNRVGGDLMLTILATLKANNIEIPFPQRDVHIISDPSQHKKT